MQFGEFFREKILTVLMLIFILFTIEIFMLIYDVGLSLKVYIPVSIITVYLIGMLIEFYKKKNYYNNTLERLKELEQKYLISEVMRNPNFLEAEILKEILQEADKSMLENVNKYKHLQEEYKEYIELWIHEIKLPIAASKMVIENNKNEITKSIDEELNKIEAYTEQALFYARSNSVEKDYCITKNNLRDIINNVIKKNKEILISNKIKIDIEEVDKIIYTDSKWAEFILNQLISNSVKYSKENNNSIRFNSKEEKNKVILYIKDEGIGIKKGEITRVFEKGFTGINGRINGKKSTGIGLYLCKKLCNKLGLSIELNSEENIGTEVRLVFPKGSFTNV